MLILEVPLMVFEKRNAVAGFFLHPSSPHILYTTKQHTHSHPRHLDNYTSSCNVALWSMDPLGLRPKKFQSSVAVLPAPVLVSSQKPLTLSVASVTSVANDMVDNEIILGAVHRSPGICLTADGNPRKPQLGDRLMKGPCDQSSPQMGSLSSK